LLITVVVRVVQDVGAILGFLILLAGITIKTAVNPPSVVETVGFFTAAAWAFAWHN
jgi:hypothetical protein